MGTFIAPKILLSGLLGTALVSCGEITEFSEPKTPLPDKFKAAQAEPVKKVNVQAPWWRNFRDPTLDHLVAIALQGNLELAQARLRVTEADALVLTSAPVVDISGRIETQVADSALGGNRDFASINGRATIVGSARYREEAARARSQIAVAELDAARLLLLSNLTSAYIDLRFVQKRLGLKYQELKSWQQTSSDLQILEREGATTRLEVLQPTAEIAETRAEIAVLGVEVERQKNRIATLLGKVAGVNEVNLNYRGQPYPRFKASSGVPADLLSNRPDIRSARSNYRLAVAELNVAEADRYPSLDLSGTILGRSDLSPTRNGIAILGLNIPIFNQGANNARVKARHARADAAFLGWKSRVLVAMEQVQTLLVAQRKLQNAVGASSQSVKLNTEALNLSRELFKAQEMSVLDFVRLQRNKLDAEANLAQNRRQRALNYVALQIALGAGSAAQPIAQSN
ncbi:MAG: efflux transporter outer membrane subunit [Pseudomonadota bacterium]|nr:efflux transporter outer membrane subunit [Pseudomonadota bacterium]